MTEHAGPLNVNKSKGKSASKKDKARQGETNAWKVGWEERASRMDIRLQNGRGEGVKISTSVASENMHIPKQA